MQAINFIHVTAENVADVGVFCIKNKKAPGYAAKVNWFKDKCNKGLCIDIVTDEADKQLGFIEYLPSELAWRPIKAENYMFIQCIAMMSKSDRNQGIASMLIQKCEQKARNLGMYGICTMSSGGVWMANKNLFKKNEFEQVDQLDRFELMVKKFKKNSHDPHFINWSDKIEGYKGWHIIYADQCPWHVKSVEDLLNTAMDMEIDLNVKQLANPAEAQEMPCGFGTFALIHDGKLLADHYISQTRFKNILAKQRRNNKL